MNIVTILGGTITRIYSGDIVITVERLYLLDLDGLSLDELSRRNIEGNYNFVRPRIYVMIHLKQWIFQYDYFFEDNKYNSYEDSKYILVMIVPSNVITIYMILWSLPINHSKPIVHSEPIQPKTTPNSSRSIKIFAG